MHLHVLLPCERRSLCLWAVRYDVHLLWRFCMCSCTWALCRCEKGGTERWFETCRMLLVSITFAWKVSSVFLFTLTGGVSGRCSFLLNFMFSSANEEITKSSNRARMSWMEICFFFAGSDLNESEFRTNYSTQFFSSFFRSVDSKVSSFVVFEV